jgi:hypothetical protein
MLLLYRDMHGDFLVTSLSSNLSPMIEMHDVFMMLVASIQTSSLLFIVIVRRIRCNHLCIKQFLFPLLAIDAAAWPPRF